MIFIIFIMEFLFTTNKLLKLEDILENCEPLSLKSEHFYIVLFLNIREN